MVRVTLPVGTRTQHTQTFELSAVTGTALRIGQFAIQKAIPTAIATH